MVKQGSIAIVGLSFAALAMASVSIYRSSRPATPSMDAGQSSSLEAIETRLDSLEATIEKRLEALESERGSISVDPSKVATTPNRSVELRPALAKLETRIGKLENAAKLANMASAQRTRERQVRERQRPKPMKLSEARMKATNAALSEEDRLRALRHLRGIPGGRNPSVVASMIQLAQTSQDGDTRADVWRQLSGAKDPQLIAPLLQAAQFDTETKAREEAIETLSDYRTNANVMATLKRLADTAKDDGIRKEALRALGRRRR